MKPQEEEQKKRRRRDRGELEYDTSVKTQEGQRKAKVS